MALTTSRFTKPCFTEGKLRARDHRARCEPSTLLLGAPQLVPGWVRALEKTQKTSPRTLWWGMPGKGAVVSKGSGPSVQKVQSLALSNRLLGAQAAHGELCPSWASPHKT